MNARAFSTFGRWTLLAVACLTSTGCFSKGVVRGEAYDLLQRPGNHSELVLQTKQGATRIGPNTTVRFLRTDDEWSAWIEGRDLCVTPDAVFRCSALPGGTGLPWKNVTGVEAKNLNGAATYFTIIGIVVGTAVAVAVTVAAVAAVAGIAKGGGGSGSLPRIDSVNLSGGHGSHRARPAAKVGPTGVLSPSYAPADYDLHYAIARGWAWYGPPIEEPAEAPVLPKTELQPVPLPGAKTAAEPRPLFTPMISRRGYVRFVGALEGGTDFTTSNNGLGGASLALRLGDVVELGGGVRMAAAPERGTWTPKPSWMGFGRLLTHFDLDAGRRVAFLLGLECGAGEPKIYGRALYGIRVRLVDGLSVGVYPYNASFAVYDQDSRRRSDFGWFSFPSTAELSYAF